MSDSHAPFHGSPPNSPPPGNMLEAGLESIIFFSRWIQAPLYLGLIVASCLYAYKFGVQLFEMCTEIQHMKEEAVMIGLLGLVDITMVANLVVMTVIGGYATFVSKLDLAAHPDRPDWLEKIDAATLKIKLSASLVGISGIHLLKSFIDIDEKDLEKVKWQVIIHFTFLCSALILSIGERVLHPHHPKH
jgi:uncharacterized protein (TIGR00645 family)